VLPQRNRPVPLPGLVPDVPTIELLYTHYTVLLRPDRRFAAVTALAMDGARLVSGRWVPLESLDDIRL
jgi:hypothetical protein